MSQNQSRAETSKSTQYRKTGRSTSSNQQHHFGSGKGGGGSSAPTNPFNRSFKKKNNNAQGGQWRERNRNVNSDSSNSSLAPSVQNGVHQQQLPPRASDGHASSTTACVNQPDVLNPKITQSLPGVPSSNVSTAISDSQSTTTSAKVPGDASRPFPLQFGSINPGFMNGMQIPARTNSCPPNLDEQKKNQLTIKPAGGSLGEKDLLLPTSSPSVEKSNSSKVLRSHVEGFPFPSECAMKEENEDIESNNSGLSSLSLSSVKEKVLSEPNAANTVGRRKKKKKELYRKAEAAACRVPEEKKDTEISAEDAEITSSIGIKQTCVIVSQETAIPSKVEPDDWEDAAEISTPQLETSRDKNEGGDGDVNGLMTNRYSRDLLLKFAEQCADLPENFEITSHVADSLMAFSANVLCEPKKEEKNVDALMVSSANVLREPKKKKKKKLS